MAILSVFVMASCSDNNEPDVDTEGKELAEWIKSQVLTKDGEIGFSKSELVEGMYAVPVTSAENATQYVEELTRTKWEGTTKTVTLDGYGTIRISASEKEGVYHTLVFNVSGIPQFTLEVTTPEYIEVNNYRTPTF